MPAPHRSPLQRFIIRLAGGRRLTITLRPRPRLSRALLILLGVALAKPALALDPSSLPSGGQVVAGQAGIQQNGNQLTVNQTSDKAILNWQSFNIGSAASVEFRQSGASSVALNRVVGNDASQIHGKLQANGQVFISNPNGVLFGSNAQVDVGGLVATTLSLGDADFTQGRYALVGTSQAEVSNSGEIRANGGVALVAATVRNEGDIQARDVALAAGSQVALDMNGDGLLSLKVNANALRGEIANGGAIQAGNQVIMAAATADALAGSVVNNNGIVRATGLSIEGGRISLSGGLVSHTGSLDASAATGGTVQVAAHTFMDAGQIHADGSAGQGGQVRVAAQQVTQTGSAQISANGTKGGGSIHLQGGSGEYGKVYSSATLSAQGTSEGAKGGSIALTADSTQLRAATLNASGQAGGGSIEVGGGWQGGNAALTNARETGVNASSTLKADAKVRGDGGSVVVWSDEKTTFAGHISATGGSQSGNGGKLEVSGKDSLVFAGTVNTASPFGLGGSLLLDPKNITISDAGALFDVLNLDDPNPGAGNSFGQHAVEVGSGNIAVTAQGSNIGGISNVGAVYLFDGQSGALISSLYGGTANDKVGSSGIAVLSNGNYVVLSSNWDSNKGAVTWGNGTSGVSGTINATNSLVGSNANDRVGNYGVTALSNGNYVVRSASWDGYKGAVTWGNGTSGISGAVSAANSLIGSTANDSLGSSDITALSNGNYVISNVNWDGNKGAVTWGNGTSGVSGTVSATNSLVGSTANDVVGNNGIFVLSNGNYVVRSTSWDGYKGAVTWGNGTSGVSGAVSAANSLVGSNAYDYVGNGGLTALGNGNYVIRSVSWDGNKGAVTWGDGTSGISGAVNAANSLVGSATNDAVGNNGITVLNNGNYVVRSANWDGYKGAVTWGDGTSGISGSVSAANSLVGSNTNDRVGSRDLTALNNGNYVVTSSVWDGGKGAVTWGSGTSGINGVVSAANSLVGSATNDSVGSSGITALNNGNYVVRSSFWSGSKGAVTWGNGATGISGVVNTANSLVGSTANDLVGNLSITTLNNGNYVVSSSAWDGGKGAVTWGSGTSGINGVVSSTNSLVGSTTNDLVGIYGITVLNNDNYVVLSTRWESYKGAVTWGSGSSGVSGTVSATNSLVGSNADDRVGGGGLTALSNGNYVVRNASWDGDKGAITWGNGTSGISGTVSAANSLVGSSATDSVGGSIINELNDGRILVRLPSQTVNGVRTGRVSLLDFQPTGMPNTGFTGNPADDYSLNTQRLADILNAGTHITLQANNDILLNSNLSLSNPSGNGGHLTLQAGRNITFNASLNTDNGNLTAVAGDPGAVAAQREPGTPTITLANGVTLNIGTGTATLAAIGGDFINNAGSNAIQTSGAGRYLVYSNTPTATLEGLSSYNKHYNQDFTLGSVPTYAGSGSWFLYSIAPVLTVTPNASSQTYGDLSLAGIGYGLSGFIDGDDNASAGISGSASFTSDASASSNVGSYNLAYASGLASSLGYTFADAAASLGELNITQRLITLTASTASKVYGNVDPALAATISAGSLGNGDSLADVTGSLSREAGENVGTYDITLGSGLKAGNYSITFDANNNAISITPRAITLAATAASKIYGNLDPTLAATISAGSLGNGDSLADVTGSLSREAGENVGTYDISLGSGLKAGNYSITFDANNNAVSITPRDLLVQAQNASKLEGEANPSFSANISGWAFNEGLANLQGTLDLSTPATQVSPVGSYAITASGLSSSNYQILFSNGSLSVLAHPPAPAQPGSGQNEVLATQIGAQTSALLENADQPHGSAGSATGTAPAPTNMGQWLSRITQQVMAWNTPGESQESRGTPLGSTSTSPVTAATLLASAEDNEQLGGLIMRNSGVRLP